MLKTGFNKKILILCILLMFLAIPTAFAQDSSIDDDFIQSDLNSINFNSIDEISVGDAESLDEGNGISENYESEGSSLDLASYDTGMNLDLDSSSLNSVSNAGSNAGSNSDSDSNIIPEDSQKTVINDQKSILKGSSGTVIYISPNGNDIAGSGSLRNPYKTVSKGVSMANDGDTVYLLNGVYILNDYYINKNITLMGESQENTILDGNYSNRILSVNATDVSIINLKFQNGYAHLTNEENGGAISSKSCGYLNIINCTFINNFGDTHGGAICVFQNYRSPADKKGEIHLTIQGSTFINNTAIKMYGGALHVADTDYSGDVYVNISSSIFINNTGGREQEHTIAVSSSNSTYLDIHDSVIFADPETIISSQGAYKALVYFKQGNSHTPGDGYANVDGNWWGDNYNPADFNRTSNINVNNWIILQGSVSKYFVVATLDTLMTVNNTTLEYDASRLPSRLAIYQPTIFFNDFEIELVEGMAKNRFNGETPQDITILVDYQNVHHFQ